RANGLRSLSARSLERLYSERARMEFVRVSWRRHRSCPTVVGRVRSARRLRGAPCMTGHVFLKRYKVLRLLDEGGMSKVYLAVQLDPAREVVVKVLKDSLVEQPKVREHFRREIYILSRFQHPNAVAFYDADGEGTPPILVMEYLR